MKEGNAFSGFKEHPITHMPLVNFKQDVDNFSLIFFSGHTASAQG